MKIRPVLEPCSKEVDEQSAHKVPVVIAIEIAHGEREAKTPGAPAERATASQPTHLASHEADSAADFSRAT